MWTQGISEIVALLRRVGIAVLCVFAILLAVIPAHAADEGMTGVAVTIEVGSPDATEGETSARPDSMPCHSGGQFCGHVAPLRPHAFTTSPSSAVASAKGYFPAAHGWAPGPSELPAEPPRT